MKNFTAAHIVHVDLPTIRVPHREDLIFAPVVHWNQRGDKTDYKMRFENRLYRIKRNRRLYGLVATAYITVKGKRIYLS